MYCPADRYGDNLTDSGINITEYFCPKEIKDLEVVGTLATNTKTMFSVSVEQCTQS